MKSKLTSIICLSLTILVISPSTVALGQAGLKCSKIGNVSIQKGMKFTCIKSGKKLVWSNGTRVQKSKPSPIPQISDNQKSSTDRTDSTFEITVYSGGAGQGKKRESIQSDELPANIAPLSTTDNLKLWIYDPENRNRALRVPGIQIQKIDGSSWQFKELVGFDGILTVDLSPGSYTVDVTEPNNDQRKYFRGRYNVVVNPDKSVIVKGMTPNSLGYFTVSVILNNRRSNEITMFRSQSPCQLRDQAGSQTLSNAFPRVAGRLPNSGDIRALIIPVGFTDAPANGKPSQIYKSMAKGTKDFFYKQSQGRVTFKFSTLKDFLDLKVPVTTFKMDAYGGGNPYGLFKAGLAAADPIVDFSEFDAVYVLPPSNIQRYQILYGPAFPMAIDGEEFWTDDGRVLNGTLAGADAFQRGGGDGWEWMAHETGHLFGLVDWYTSDPISLQPYGPWDLMSSAFSAQAIELNAWNRFISGWLNEDQVRCLEGNILDDSPRNFTIEVLGVDSKMPKSVMVKLSDSKVLVFEGRATAGFDKIQETNSGLLVYTVDVSIATSNGVGRVHSRPNVNPGLTNAPLKAQESLKVGDINISVNSFENNRISFSLSR